MAQSPRSLKFLHRRLKSSALASTHDFQQAYHRSHLVKKKVASQKTLNDQHIEERLRYFHSFHSNEVTRGCKCSTNGSNMMLCGDFNTSSQPYLQSPASHPRMQQFHTSHQLEPLPVPFLQQQMMKSLDQYSSCARTY